MKRKKRFKVISLLLAVIMILSSLPFAGISAFAATEAEDAAPSLKLDIAATGETVNVTVTALAESGIAFGKFLVKYDSEKLEFVSGKQVDPALFNPDAMICVFAQSHAYAEDTEILTVTFNVKAAPISAESVTLAEVDNYTETYDSINEVVSAFTCDHSLATEEVITEATREADGSKNVTCNICGNVETDVVIHNFGEWKVTKEATTTEDGEEQRTCSVCGETETRAIPALGDESTTGDFEYEILEDGTAEITGYYGETETLEIPSTLDGYTVTSIGYMAFYSCDSLISITIPDSVTSIGDSAFEWCESLTSITIPNSVISIGDYAFYSCDSLISITIPDSVTSIGDSAFGGCDSLTSVTIPDSVTSIGDEAFRECNSLTSVTIPDSVTSIGDGAFRECNSLTSVTIPDSVTSIGDYAFYYCDSLTSVDLGKGVESIGGFIFDGCSIKSVTIRGDLKTGDYLFAGLNIENITFADGVTAIPEGICEGCNSLISVTIANSVTSIGDEAFRECNSLTSVTIPDSVTSIGDNAFAWCDSLTSITVDENNKNYSSEDGVLFNKSKTQIILYPKGKEDKAYTVPDGITDIGTIFMGNTNLEEVVIPGGVTELVYSSFSDCTSLKSVSLPNTLKSIGGYTFGDCTSLSNVLIPGSVTSIGENAFKGSALETIYGYESSYAQTYAEENGYKFVPLYTYENEESGITVDADKSELPEDTELVVTVKEETEDSVTYDISLQSGGVEVQPTGSVTVKIPVPETMDGEIIKVYRREADGTMTDMNAVYKDGFMVFTTEHFSEYMLKAEASAVKAEPGDVNGDGKINALDVLIVKRYIAKYDDAKLEGDKFVLADVSGDGKVNAKDALAIMQKIAKLITSFDEIK